MKDQLVLKLSNYFTCTPPSLIAPPIGTPSLLREIWKLGNEWHLLERDHYNCYGFNIFSIESLDDISLSIFGDSEERQAWAERETNNGKFSISCADLSWRAFASFSEFDFLFICVDEESKEHGTVRHIINNCCEEYTISGGLLSILETLLDAVEARKNKQINHVKSQGLCKSLNRMYSSILTC